MEVYILKKIIKYNTINYSQYCLLVLTCNITLTERPDNHSLFLTLSAPRGTILTLYAQLGYRS